jgi:hypothetical protein
MRHGADKAASVAETRAAEKPPRPEIAERALAEAQARRAAGVFDPRLPPEKGGRRGPEPTRYGDWEKNGIVSDF